jgi:multicomponent K+:H+ antiporter subunit D
VTAEAFGIEDDEPREGPGPAIPATMALLGVAFVGCSLVLAGLPPLPAFLAKASMLNAILGSSPVEGHAWILVALLLASGLAAMIALLRAGVGIFWAGSRTVPRVLFVEMAPVAVLLGVCLGLTVAAGPAMRYLHETSRGLHVPQEYVNAVLPSR